MFVCVRVEWSALAVYSLGFPTGPNVSELIRTTSATVTPVPDRVFLLHPRPFAAPADNNRKNGAVQDARTSQYYCTHNNDSENKLYDILGAHPADENVIKKKKFHRWNESHIFIRVENQI
jgi:hypothetical protein